VARQDEQIERLCATLKAAGISCQGIDESDKLDQAQLNRLVE
jgi:serine O-acetyltransferase